MGSLFLIVMAGVVIKDGEIYLEAQAFNGVEQWSKDFATITVLFPKLETSNSLSNHIAWKNSKYLNNKEKIKIITLPLNYSYFNFFKDIIMNYKTLDKEIKKSDYNVFSIGGITGDWGAIAALIAWWNKIEYAVWTDRVEHNVIKVDAEKKSLIKKIYNKYFVCNLMKYYHKLIIKKSELGLFHGNDCFKEYSKYTKNSFLVHDIHFKKEDHISDIELKKKKTMMRERNCFKISYVGRLEEMKGPFEWLEILALLKKKKVSFHAKWIGDGELKENIKKKIIELNLTNEVEMVGFVSDKEKIKCELQNSDLFLFCHKTPESPRNLIESLKAGTPIIGFHSDYSEDLIEEYKGGILVKDYNLEEIANEIYNLQNNKLNLVDLMGNASLDGKKYNDDGVFKHRRDLVKKYLNKT